MKLEQTQKRITELMSLWVTQVKGEASLNKTDLLRTSEDVLVPLLSELFDLKHLQNLNFSAANYPAVDLGDKEARVAIQVTATSGSEKIKPVWRFHLS